MKSIFRLLLCLLLITASVSVPYLSNAQCALTGFNETGLPANTIPPCGTFSSFNVGSGTQTSFQVVNGASYTFSTCNSSFDTQITGRNAANTQQFYDDDNGPVCATNRASVDWVATYSGTVFVVVNKYNCQGWQGVGSTSAILDFRQNNNLNITSASTAMCPGATRTLTATPTGGAFNGTGVSGGVFTAPASGPVTITYTLGSCSVQQSININTPQVAPTGATSNPTSTCGGQAVLSVQGGTLGTGGSYQWYAGGCGAGSVLGTGSSLTVTPSTTTTYYVRITGTCSPSGTACQSTTVTVNSFSVDPTGIGTSANNFCSGGTATLTVQGGSLGTGATWRWYSGTCCTGGSIGSGTSINVTPTATTTYFVRAEGGGCGTSNSASITINVNSISTAPTGVTSTNGTLFCNGLGTTTLNVQGGSLGTGGAWKWYTASCGGTLVGTGPSINVNPTSNTTYFVRAEGTCPPPTTCAQITINVSSGLTSTLVKTDVTCNGANNGTITVTPTGGQAGYTYQWSSGSGGATRTNLAPGTYNVTITDAVGCTTTNGTTINQPQALGIISVTKQNISCNGGNSGVITISATGGTNPLRYTINNFGTVQSSNQFTGLAVGSYTVGVIDTNGCTTLYNANPVVISQPPALSISVTSDTDPSCSGVNNGSISVQGAGGAGGYQYTLNGSPFQIGTTFSNLSAGNYTICVQDASGCLACVNDTLVNITTVVLTVDTTINVSCAGRGDGGFRVTLSNGVLPYQYSINGITYQNNGTFTSLSGGNYTVLGRDAAGCQDVAQITITEATPLVVIVDSVHNLSCNGSASGGAFISVSGGTPGNVPTYSALSGNTRSASGLNDGTFSSISGGVLTGRPAANGTCCSAQNPPIDIYEFTVTASGSYTINNDYTSVFDGFMFLYTDPLNWAVNPPATFVAGNDNCSAFFNSCVTANLNVGQTYYLVTTRATGTNATETWTSTFAGPGNVLAITGFASGYTYQWSNGAITQDIDSVPAGNYSVTITDNNGCTARTSVSITQPLPLTVSLANLAEVRCNGGTDGEIDITVTGGTPPYTFAWSNGTTTEDNTNLVAGNYSVTVRDASGCSVTNTYTLSQPTAIVITGVITSAACGTNPNGAVDVTVTGGTPPYSYFWSNGQTTQDITNLSPGIYTVQVLDSRSCMSSASFTVGGGSSLNITLVSVTPVTCYGDSTGAVNISVTGGATPLTYAWSNGANTQNIAGVPAGSYTVTVTDANGCQDALTATVTQPNAFIATATSTNVTCNGNANGTITVTITGGTPTITYLWSDGAVTRDRTGLSGGTYSLTATDANGCKARVTVTITEPTAITLQGAVSNVRCNGGNTGTISVNAAGGVPSYTYLWSNGVTAASVYNLVAGTYNVTVTDANGCTLVRSYTITQPSAITVTANGTNVSCNGGTNGTVSASATGGTGAFTYLWSNFSTSATQSGLAAGTYTVVATDANGCTATGSYTITQPQPITVTQTVVNVSCNGGANGSIAITLSGGTGPFNVTWSNGAFTNGTTTSTITNLAAGTYGVTATDQNGCTATRSYTITQPTAITLTTQVTNAGCNGAATGAVDLTVTGGNSPYTYVWSGGAGTNQDLTNVAAGTYTVTVTDASGCTATTSATVGQPTAIALQGTVVNASCNGSSNGSIYLNVTGGTPSYTFLWSNAATSQNLINVAAGTYTVTVTDTKNCTATGTYTVTAPTAVTATHVITNVACYGASTGAVNLTVAGGTAPYTFLWSNFSSSEDLTGVPAGTYVVVITDANGCKAMDTSVVTQNTALALTATVTNLTCSGANNGSILVNVTGGVSPYTYIWSSGGTAAFEQNLAPGTYTVTVTDNAGCTASGSYTISGPTPLASSGVVSNITCNGANNGSIDLTVTGGTMPYVYLWSNNATSEDISGLAPATYDVRVTDANGCIIRDTFTITEPTAIVTSIVGSDATCSGFGNGTAILTVTGGTGPYTFFWSNFRFTQNIYNLKAGQYFVIVSDANGCQTVDSVTIDQPNALLLTGSAKGAGCGNEARGAVDITVTGGTMPYTYAWSTGQGTEDITGLGTGTYCVTVTDDNGCQAFFCAVVTSFPLPTANFTSTLACDDQEVTFTNLSNISAGSMSYVWNFDDGSATTTDQDPIHTFTAPGTYAVSLIATSNEGCADTLTQNVVVNPTPDATITSNGQSGSVCNGDSVVLEAPIGTGYSYLWSTGDSSQTITVFSSGTYSVTITSGALCNGIGSIEVGIFSQSAVTVSADTTISRGFSVMLVATGGSSYEWSPSSTLDNAFSATPIATPINDSTTYSVTVTVSTGCVTTREVTVKLKDDYRLDLPNLFTPNGDGINDRWVIKNIFTYNAEVFVFNRWGTEVFSSNNYQNDWNGTNSSGDDLSDGTYYYVVTVGDKVYKGAVTILR